MRCQDYLLQNQRQRAGPGPHSCINKDNLLDRPGADAAALHDVAGQLRRAEPGFTLSQDGTIPQVSWAMENYGSAAEFLRIIAAVPNYLLNSFCRSVAFEVVCSASMRRILALCAGRLSAKTAPASLSVLPPPVKP